MKKLLLLLLTSCATQTVRLHTVDHSGVTATIEAPTSFDPYKPQPYQKVCIAYPDHTQALSYYPSGLVRQSLDIVGGRACGTYKEWHPNGQVKLLAKVVGGSPDIDPASLSTYLFDGVSRVWDEEGELEAEFHYKNGLLHGLSIASGYREEWCEGKLITGTYDHPEAHIADGNGIRSIDNTLQEYKNGEQEGWVHHYEDGHLTFSIPWHKGEIHGPVKTYYPNGQLQSQREMDNTQKHGLTTAWYPDGQLMLVEEYSHDRLTRGEYYSPTKKVSSIEDGKGVAILHDAEGHVLKKISYLDGQPREG